MTSDKAAAITRWDIGGSMYGSDEMFASEYGDYVLYTDHAAALQAVRGEASQIERENIEGWKQATHWREKAEAAERRVAELESALYEARAELLSCRMNISADLFKGNLAWEGVPAILDARIEAINAALAPAKKVD